MRTKTVKEWRDEVIASDRRGDAFEFEMIHGKYPESRQYARNKMAECWKKSEAIMSAIAGKPDTELVTL